MGCDSSVSWAMLPSAAGSGSATTYYSDGVWSSTGWRVCERGGAWSLGPAAGVFAVYVADASSLSDDATGCRLLYLPA